MELRKLRHAVVLARLLNFTKAAEVLNLTQSALSRSIQALEDECQLRLFDRNRNMVAVTAVGHEFVRHAEALLRNEAELMSMVSQAARGEGGSILLGMVPFAVRTVLAPIMAEMVGQPGFHADVTIGQPKRLLSLLLDESIELCVCTALDMPTNSPFAEVRLTHFPLALIVRSDHPLTRAESITPQDLEPFPMVRTRPFELDSDTRSIIAVMPQKRPAVTVEDYYVLMQITASSDAVWITSPVSAREAISNGTLKTLPFSWPSGTTEIEMTAYHLKSRTLSPLAEKLLARMVCIAGELFS